MRIRSFNIILVVLLGVLCTLGIVSAAEITPPSVPPGLVATAQSSSQVNLSWAASTDRVAAIGSDIYGGDTKIGTLAANSYSDSGLPATTIYSYTVSSYEAAGNTSGQPASASTNTLLANDWTLAWSDEFSGSSIDTTYWNVENSATQGYGGNLQYWTPQNVIVQDGMLRLISKQELMGGKQYTSGALTTKGKMTFSGNFRLEIRAKLPKGQGIWPAIWTREGQMPNPDNGAEIDLMEMLGHQPSLIYMTHHSWGTAADDRNHTTRLACQCSGPDYSADFHTYALEIDSGGIRWYIDGVQRCGPSTAGLPTQPSHILLNTSIGGSWPGSPDSSTVFPQYFDIDYLRIYQKTSTSPPAAPKNLRKR